MGRRIFLILAMMLSALSTARATRGQDPDPEAPPSRPASVTAPSAPAEFPPDVKLPGERNDTDDNPRAPTVTLPGARDRANASSTEPAAKSRPAPGDDWKRQLAPPLTDDKVIQAQATAAPPGQPGQVGAETGRCALADGRPLAPGQAVCRRHRRRAGPAEHEPEQGCDHQADRPQHGRRRCVQRPGRRRAARRPQIRLESARNAPSREPVNT